MLSNSKWNICLLDIFFSHPDLWQPYLLIVSLLYILFCYIVQFKMKYLFIRHIFQPPWSLTTISTYRQLARHSFQLCDKINLPWHTPWFKIHPTCRKSSDAPSVTVSLSSNLSLSRKLIFLRKIQFCLIYLFLIFAQTLSKSLMKTFFGPKRFLNFKQLFCLIK